MGRHTQFAETDHQFLQIHAPKIDQDHGRKKRGDQRGPDLKTPALPRVTTEKLRKTEEYKRDRENSQ
jgi:hypothetical protein